MTKIVKMSSAAVVTGTFSKSLYPDFSFDWYFKSLYHNFLKLGRPDKCLVKY